MFLVRRRLYDAITSLVCFSRVLVPLMLRSKRRVRRKDRVASETEPQVRNIAVFNPVLMIQDHLLP